MVKKVISIATAFLMLFCMIPFAAFAETVVCPKCGESTLTTNQDIFVSVGEQIGLPLSLKRAYCSNCHYAKYEYNILGIAGEQAYDDGDELHIINFLKNLKAELLGQNATAEKVPTGIGRKDLPGYADDKGSALVNKDGYPSSLYVMDIGGYDSYYGYSLAYKCKYKAGLSTWRTADNLCTQFTNGSTTFSSGNAFSSSYLNNNVNKTPVLYIYYYFKPTFSGYYTFSVPTFSVTTDSKNEKNEHQNFNGTYIANVRFGLSYNEDVFNTDGMKSLFYSDKQDYSKSFSCANYTTYLTRNQFVFIRFSAEFYADYSSLSQSVPYRALSLKTSAPSVSAQNVEASYQNNNNITINNNTWNGNIYTDNSTNLTYIYPQYTTINENNETVTNISNNPIIYNSETKQYYTYDSVTNNYYYITYEAPATPTPSPSPSPSPSPAPTETPSPSESPTPTPDPGTNPTSTPKPGDSGDISTPESGKPGSSSGSGQSWWDKLLDKIGNAVIDGLLSAVSAVLKLILKLFSTILGWIIWLVSQVLTLFPFLPPGLGALLIGGVVVCFVIGIIKFIRG